MHSTATPQPSGHVSSAIAQPGKYLTFTLGNESYGIPVLKVREIIRLCPITPVANMPEHVKGVINLRGKVIPLVDLRAKFCLTIAIDNNRTCIIVTQLAAAAGGTFVRSRCVGRRSKAPEASHPLKVSANSSSSSSVKRPAAECLSK